MGEKKPRPVFPRRGWCFLMHSGRHGHWRHDWECRQWRWLSHHSAQSCIRLTRPNTNSVAETKNARKRCLRSSAVISPRPTFFALPIAFFLGKAIIGNMDKTEMANYVIDSLGGTSAVARLCEIEPPSVTGWRSNGIPKAWLRYFRCSRPDIFKALPSRKYPRIDTAA